ncbi:uncharacterized protein LOC110414285 [Herrania umbratica]|uniref:Uncharacterized protein LOC110414285 n=1 Tax=Herrania umbratica TaxID=108875 RepID=A0A6J1A1N4_9ROSI|nr:uncharacterized protein LOC110414285 [Herrania umbratica]
MAPSRRMRQQAPKPEMSNNVRVRLHIKRVKAEMEKIREDQQRLREEQSKIRGRSGEIESQLDLLKMETEMIMKQTASTQIKLLVMFKILKARAGGYSAEAARLTHFLREYVAKERANASLVTGKKKHP